MIPEKDNQHGASLSTAAVRIEAAPVQRDENGHWTHPAVPPFDEGQEVQYLAWLDSNGLEITYKMLESESEHPLHDAYFEDGECNISTWTPAAPEGDGWFTLSIHDTEDGPIWVWARRATPQHPDLDTDVEELALKHIARSLHSQPVALYRTGEYKKTEQFRRLKAFAVDLLSRRATPQHSATEQADVQTDIAARLRAYAAGPMSNQDHAKLMATAADECDRFYNGMMNWKANAQAKDRTIIEQREQLAQPLASTAAQPEQTLRQALQALYDARIRSQYPSWEKGIPNWNAAMAMAEAALAIPASTAASEQQAGADELPTMPQPMVATRHGTPCYTVGQMMDYARAALTHRATTAPVIPQCRHCDVEPGEVHHSDCPDRAERVFMPAYHANTADQQGDTASECVYVSLQADSLDDWERYVFETCSKAQNIYDLHFRIGDQEWKGSLREVMAALRGAAQPQVRDALQPIVLAVTINDTDTLAMNRPDSDIIWTAEGHWGSASLTMGDLRRLAELATSGQAGEATEPNMFWQSDDTDLFASSPAGFATNYACNCLCPGESADVDVDCATRAGERTMRIAMIDGGEDDHKIEWKWVERTTPKAAPANPPSNQDAEPGTDPLDDIVETLDITKPEGDTK